MESLILNHFKAFNSRIAFMLDASRKNLLVFGENGSGKTSIYEAIRLCFFRDRLVKPHITIGGSPTQKANDEQNYFRSYNYKTPAGTPMVDFTLQINSTDFKVFSPANYQCFMVSYADLQNNGTINLPALLKKAFLTCGDIDAFVSSKVADIIKAVNSSLEKEFMEDAVIGQENVNNDIFISNRSGSLKESNGLNKVFNEAKINLVIILLLLQSILLMREPEPSTKHNILVVDDIITSLDASNRKYLIEFLLKKFVNFQKIIFTHNIGFNNLICKSVKRIDDLDKWSFQNVYITNRGPQQYFYDEFGKAQDILDQFNSGMLQPNTVGNELRKRFEADIYELAKLIHQGEVHQATMLVGRMVDSTKPIYFNRDGDKRLVAEDLVKAILGIASGTDTDADKVQKIKDEIEKYATNTDLTKMVEIIKEMHFYEKIMIHQLSHGSSPMPNFNQKEVEDAIKMIVTLENLIKQFHPAKSSSTVAAL